MLVFFRLLLCAQILLSLSVAAPCQRRRKLHKEHSHAPLRSHSLSLSHSQHNIFFARFAKLFACLSRQSRLCLCVCIVSACACVCVCACVATVADTFDCVHFCSCCRRCWRLYRRRRRRRCCSFRYDLRL